MAEQILHSQADRPWSAKATLVVARASTLRFAGESVKSVTQKEE